MSKIQEFITAWNTAVDAEIVKAQSDIDAYLAARQTAISLTDTFVLKIPVAQKESDLDLLIPGFDATTLGQIFEWTYPIEGEITTRKDGYYDDKRGLITRFSLLYDVTDTNIYIDGYTYGTMSYLSSVYKTALNSRDDLDKPLREAARKSKSLESYKKLKNLGGKAWFDNWMHSLYSVISGTKISVSKLKASEYSSIFMRIEDVMRDNYLKGYYDEGTSFKIDGINASAENSKYFQAVLEAGDAFFPTQNSGTQSGTQSSQPSGDYTLAVINPLTDNDKKITGKIVFIEDAQYLIPNSTLNGLPNPWTNPVTNTLVPNNTGTITYNGNKSTAGKSALSSDIIINLQNIVQSTYGLTIYLKSTPQDTPTELPPPDADVPVGSTASVESATASQVLPLQDFIFNVELRDIFSNTDFGNLFIIGKEDTIVFDDDQVDYSEYVEEDFQGEEEIQIDLPAVELSFDMAEARINDTSDNVPTSGNFEASAKLKPSKLTKSMSFTQVTEAVISNLEGGYFHPDMTKDGRVKDSRYSTSGETMFGLDRKQGDSKSVAAKNFWSEIDASGARSKWRWNHMPKEPLYSQLVKLAAAVIEPKFNSSLNSYCPDKNIQALIKSDGRLMFNVIYAQWNGPGWIKGLLKVINEEYDSGKKTAESLLKSSVIERVNGGYRMYKLGTGKSLQARSASLIAQGGQKIAKLTGVQVA